MELAEGIEDEDAAALHKNIARYRRSIMAINDPDTLKKLEQMIKEAQARLDIIERRSPSDRN